MKLDPNSREELPAVVRVAAHLMSGLYVQGNDTAHVLAGTAMLGAETLIAAYNEGQPDEPSELAEAVAAGDGTLHGAIDYWQKRADRAERAEQKLADERAMHGLTLSRAERAEARAEAAEKDAGRYQWLRDESWKGINGTFAARWCLVANRGAGLDAAIDAAIAEVKA